jgi:hypothetical protein
MKKRHGTALLAGIALTLAAASTLHAAERAHVGKWEFVSTVDGQSTTRNFCIKPAQAQGINGDAAADRAFLEKKAAAHHCTIKDFKLEADTLSYTQVCAGYTFSDRTTYRGDSSEGELTTKMDGKPALVTHVKGRRLGDCP